MYYKEVKEEEVPVHGLGTSPHGYGAIAFNLAHQAEVDANIYAGEQEFDRSAPALSQTRPELYERLQRAREQMTKGS